MAELFKNMDDNLTIPQGLDPQVVNLARAIRKQESGGDYKLPGDSGSSLGAYQWNNQPTGKSVPLKSGELPSNWISDAKETGLDPNDFSPKNQDMVAYNKIKKLKDAGHNVVDIAAIWNGGDAKRQDPNYVTPSGLPSQKNGVYDVPAYAKAVNDYYQDLKEKTGESNSNTQDTTESNSKNDGYVTSLDFPKTDTTITDERQKMIDAGQPVSVNQNKIEPTWAGKKIRGLIEPFAQVAASGKNLVQAIQGKPETDIHSKYLGDVERVGKGFDITSMSPESVKGALNAAKTGVKIAGTIEGVRGLGKIGGAITKGLLTKKTTLENPIITKILKQGVQSRQGSVDRLTAYLKNMPISKVGGEEEQLIMKALKELNPTLVEKQALIKRLLKEGYSLTKGAILAKLLGVTVGGIIHKNTE